MAIIGFILTFLLLLYASFAVVFAAWGSIAFSGKLGKEGGTILGIGVTVLSCAWYFLFTNAPFTLSVVGG